MAFVPDSYLRAEAGMDEILKEVNSYAVRLDDMIAQLNNISSSLSNLTLAAPTGWLDLVNYIDAQASANPLDANWQDLKSRKDKIVSDFQAFRTKVNSTISAMNAV